MSARKFTTRAAAAELAGMTAGDLLSRCHAAARLAARGDSYSPEDRRDIAADVLVAVLERLPLSCPVAEKTGTARPSDVLAYVSAVMDRSRIPDLLPPALAPSFTELHGMACNGRRSIDRRRARDTADAAAKAAAGEGFTPHVPEDAPEVRATPWGARRTAVAMLRDLGALGRKVDFPSPLWTAAYASARAAAGLESDAIAAELELSPAAYRKHLQRAGERLPSVGPYGVPAHAAALDLPDTARAVKPAKSRTDSADLGHRARDWRTRPDTDAPLRCRSAGGKRRTAARPPASWTAYLGPATAARLAKAAELSRARTQAKTPAQRAADRLAAGVTGTVR